MGHGLDVEAAYEACSRTFYWPAQADYGRWDPVYEERFPLDEAVWQKSEAAFLACFEEEGDGCTFDDYDEAMDASMPGRDLARELTHYCFVTAFVD
jgi:hypothetical protein